MHFYIYIYIQIICVIATLPNAQKETASIRKIMDILRINEEQICKKSAFSSESCYNEPDRSFIKNDNTVFEYEDRTSRPNNSNNVSYDGDKEYLEYDLLRYPTGARRTHHTEKDGRAFLPEPGQILPGYSRLSITEDRLQTALDAFAIIRDGSIKDILLMPRKYLLNSIRTIAMMRLPPEKYGAVWRCIKGNVEPRKIPYNTLVKSRSLFRYIPARDMMELELRNPRILSLIGTHPDLNRMMAGVIVSKFISVVSDGSWRNATTLNRMNGLICGLPVALLKTIPYTEFRDLHVHFFHHVQACDPQQRKHLLAVMSKTEVLGGPAIWDAIDIVRMGLLLHECTATQLREINPNAMIAISTKVIKSMPPYLFQFLTKAQIERMSFESRLIIARNAYSYRMRSWEAFKSGAGQHCSSIVYILICLLLSLVSIFSQ